MSSCYNWTRMNTLERTRLMMMLMYAKKISLTRRGVVDEVDEGDGEGLVEGTGGVGTRS